jgi:hypothetical protein
MIKTRIEQIDILRGIFLILMICLHVGYSFLSDTSIMNVFIPILRMSTIGFPLLVGVVLGLRGFSSKNIQRGFILVGIFLILNLIISALNSNFGFLSQLFNVLLIGNQDTTAFEILLPIGYILIFSKFIALLNKNWHIFLIILAMLSWEWFFHSYNLVILTSGLVGYAIGKNYNKLNIQQKLLIPLIFGWFLAIILSLNLGINWIVDVVTTTIFSLIFLIYPGKIFIANVFSTFGQHTLIVYILQIGLFKAIGLVFCDFQIVNLTEYLLLSLVALVFFYFFNILLDKLKNKFGIDSSMAK